MKIVRGKNINVMERDQIITLAREYVHCLVDIGTGDGRFLHRWAQEHHDTLCIGIDPVAASMRRTSSRCQRKPARGGTSNVLFVQGSVQRLPLELAELADTITINYPWGSLLQALVLPDQQVLFGIRRLARPGAYLVMLINISVFEDAAYRQRLQLPELTPQRVATDLQSCYAAAGIAINDARVVDRDTPFRTSWGQRLHLGSHRRALVIEARVAASPQE